MRESTIARNYAETLVELATRAEDLSGWGAMIGDVAAAIEGNDRLRHFLESPRVSADDKNAILARAFQDRFPRLFVRFLQAVIRHRRQSLIPQISIEYDTLVDEMSGRVHAMVTVAREPDDDARREIAERLSAVLDKAVVPHFTVKPEILGGVVVRVGDTVMDGSLRRRLARLRGQMLGAAGR
ncbi:MAG TPA: ATP synthase F1 subunit delta [Gemmatimonadaceae bacterium]|nr:ATP synthase F1 subunit delta [Gemmatimonadaceae bacterium]